MNQVVPNRVSVVVIGGGVIGASVAYHLSRFGFSDVLLLERRQFACGTSWHAAGLIGTVRASESLAQLCEYSMALLAEIEQETGQSTGFRQIGSLTIAHSPARFEELKRTAAMNNAFGVTRVDMVTAQEAQSLYPLLDPKGLLGASWVAHDGTASPIDVTMAFIKGARARGALCLENVEVTDILTENRKVRGVKTTSGEVHADYVVVCGGMWSRELVRRIGVNIPLQACEHYYAHTEKSAEISADLPVLRDHDQCAYLREDAGSLLVGAFEPLARPWALDGIPKDFCFDELPGDPEQQLFPILEAMGERLPFLAETGWRQFFCGPESFTPDGQFHIGETPEIDHLFVACGLNSVGIQSAGGIGKALAEWIRDGRSPLDLLANDIRRVFPFQGTKTYLRDRVSETLGLLYANHYPYRQYASARDVRHSPLHERLAAHNACFGELAGWERANWFAPPGVSPQYEYSFGRQNWFDYSAQEHLATREACALYDLSSFSKYLVQGRDACSVLQRICTADVDVEPGRIVYTHWLNENGGIEADLTVTRLAEDQYVIVSAAAATGRDLDWLRRHSDSDAFCVVTDITSGWAVLALMGPNSRALLSAISDHDFDSEHFAFGAAQTVELGCAVGRAHRVSYVGELGWELYVPADQARHLFDTLLAEGDNHGLKLAGMHALDSCRLERGFAHYGHDIVITDTPYEAGMGFVCNFNKPTAFIGREALLTQRENAKSLTKRLVNFCLEDPRIILYHHEPILRDGQIVGHLSSGSYGHSLGGAVGMGYVSHAEGVSKAYIDSGRFEIDVGGERVAAKASLRAFYDPSGSRMRA